jgi:hypothetical protein
MAAKSKAERFLDDVRAEVRGGFEKAVSKLSEAMDDLVALVGGKTSKKRSAKGSTRKTARATSGPGRGRKLCPNCKNYVGVRSQVCPECDNKFPSAAGKKRGAKTARRKRTVRAKRGAAQKTESTAQA